MGGNRQWGSLGYLGQRGDAWTGQASRLWEVCKVVCAFNDSKRGIKIRDRVIRECLRHRGAT